MPTTAEARGRLKRRKTLQQDASPVVSTPGFQRHGLHACKYCDKDVSQQFRIKCAVCPGFHLCLDCFRVGAEITAHKRDHDYQVHGDLSFSLHDPRWRADEELLLLEAVDAHGLGSWAAVSARVGTHTASDCRNHYLAAFLRTQAVLLPQPEVAEPPIAKAELEFKPSTGPAERALPGDGGAAPPATGAAAGDPADPLLKKELPAVAADGPSSVPERNAEGGLEGVDTLAAAPPKKVRPGTDVEESAQQQQQEQQQQQTSTRGLPTARPLPEGQGGAPAVTSTGFKNEPGRGGKLYELTGFHAKRREFEHEYDNNSELLISDLEISPSDTQEERAEKLRLVDVYNQRLTVREQRREAAISQGLVDVRRHQIADRRLTPAERDMAARLRVFARFQPAAEHDKTVDGFLLEERLRLRLKELQGLRAAGVRTLADAEQYGIEQRRQAAAALGAGRAPDRSQRYLARTGVDDALVMSQAALASMAASDSSSRARELGRLRSNSPAPFPSGMGRRTDATDTASQLAAWRNRRGVALDVTGLPGTTALSRKERSLCATYRVLPSQYLACKASLLREAQRRDGPLTRADAAGMFCGEPACMGRIHSLLLSAGWLRDGDAHEAETSAVEEGEGVRDGPAPVSPAHSSMES